MPTDRKPSGLSLPTDHCLKPNHRYVFEPDLDELNVVSTPSTIHERGEQQQSTDFDTSLLQYYQGELDHATPTKALLLGRETGGNGGDPERTDTPRNGCRGERGKGGSLARRVSKLPPIGPGVKVYHFTKKEIGQESLRRPL